MDKLNINMRRGQKVFFTSDTHFGHKNILKFCNRPFENIKQHNEALVQYWNETVGPNDIIFHLGDFFWFNSRTETLKLIKQLNGQIYVVPGNHDTINQFEYCLRDLPNFHLISDVACVFLTNYDSNQPGKSIEIYLSHFVLSTWSHRDRKAINLFGHIHSGPLANVDFDDDIPLRSYQYDVGCDNNNYRPIEIREILKIMDWPNKNPNDFQNAKYKLAQ